MATAPERDAGRGLAGAGPLEHRPGVVEAVLLHADEVGVARPRAGQRGVAGQVRELGSASTGSAAMTVDHLGHSVLPTRTATGPPWVTPVAHAAEELDLVALERHPGAAAVAEPAPGELVRDLRRW